MDRNRVEEPAVTFQVSDEVSVQLFPLAAGQEIQDPCEEATWPGPGIVALIKTPTEEDLRYFFLDDQGFWQWVQMIVEVADDHLTPQERRELLESLGPGATEP